MTVQPMQGTDAARGDGAVDRTVRVLEALAGGGGPYRLSVIASKAELPKSTVHRLMTQLTAAGYARALGDGHYAIGVRFRSLAAQVAGRGQDALREVLLELQSAVHGHTVHLAVRDGDRAVYVNKVDGEQPFRMASRIGSAIPLHCTAIGKALLATLPTAEVDDVLSRTGLPGRTPATITDIALLHRELAAVRARGYAIDDEENELRIRCIAVPVGGGWESALGGGRSPAVGGLSVSTVAFERPGVDLAAFAGPLRAAAAVAARVLE